MRKAFATLIAGVLALGLSGAAQAHGGRHLDRDGYRDRPYAESKHHRASRHHGPRVRLVIERHGGRHGYRSGYRDAAPRDRHSRRGWYRPYCR